MKIKRTETPVRCEKKSFFGVTRCVYLGGVDQTWCAKYGKHRPETQNPPWWCDLAWNNLLEKEGK